jgi:hypothetical protein
MITHAKVTCSPWNSNYQAQNPIDRANYSNFRDLSANRELLKSNYQVMFYTIAPSLFTVPF